MKNLLSALALSATLVPCALAQQPQPTYLSDPKFQKEVAAAEQPHQTLPDQIGHWKKASKIANETCAPCLEHVAALDLRSGDLKDSIKFSTAFEQAATRPTDKAYAELLHGSALLHMKEGNPNPDQLREADTTLKASVANDPTLHTAAYLDGLALARLNDDGAAREVFAAYVASTPATDRYHLRAQHFAENPALARAKMAPPFTVTTAGGKSFTLDDMGGRVVLVDFWATWCGPCNAELPHIKKIAQEFANQPFVLISVSWDSDPGKWQAFIDKNNMTWNQYRDADHQLSTAYGVNAIPHYFTIDSDGILQSEDLGEGANIEGRLKKLVAKAKAANPPSTLNSTDGGS